MKNKLMILVILAGILTAGYRFLPLEQRQKLLAQFNLGSEKLLHSAGAENSPPHYKLTIPDGSAHTQRESASESASEAEQYIHSRERTDYPVVASAYIQHLQNVQVEGQGRVIKILEDDIKGSKHQRFMVRTPEDVTVLIVHNIDLAPRLRNLRTGDTVEFFGEYVWNEKGGLVHWTHRDPNGRHIAGWLKYDGAIYQ